MVIVRARLVEQGQVLSYYDTVLYNYSRLLLSTVKKWQTRHQVPRCWPHSTLWRSPGHGIGRPGLMATSWLFLLRNGSCITHSPFLHTSHSRHSVWPQTLHTSHSTQVAQGYSWPLLCSGSCISHILFDMQFTFQRMYFWCQNRKQDMGGSWACFCGVVVKQSKMADWNGNGATRHRSMPCPLLTTKQYLM